MEVSADVLASTDTVYAACQVNSVMVLLMSTTLTSAVEIIIDGGHVPSG